MILRRKTKNFAIGNLKIGSENPVTVQSMISVPSTDVSASVNQAVALKEAGCDIVRIAVPDMNAVSLIDTIKSAVDIPLVADIHFDYKLALECVAAGIDKIRINPGNIGNVDNFPPLKLHFYGTLLSYGSADYGSLRKKEFPSGFLA